MVDQKINTLPPAPGDIDPTDEIIITGNDAGSPGYSYRRPISELAALFEPPLPPGGSGLGSGGWELHGSWVQSVNGNATGSLDFTGLAGVSDIKVVILGVTKSSAAGIDLLVSQDNGATFFNTSGNYISFTTGAPTNQASFFLPGGSTTASRSGAAILFGCESHPALATPVNSGGVTMLFAANSSPIDAIRIIFGAGSLTAGSILVFKRRLPRYRVPSYTLAAANALSGLQDGDVVIITDASSPVKGVAVSGSGSTKTMAFRSGSDWIAA